MKADLIIRNGKCILMNHDKEIANWIAVKEGKIIDVGYGEEYEALIDINTIIKDAEGNSVIPGFIDSHFHVVLTALNIASIDLSRVRCFDEIGEMIKEVARLNPGMHIRGIHLQVEQLMEKRFPTRTELDKYCNTAPVSLHSSDYQVSILNTCGMLYFKIPFMAEGVELDEKEMPNGIFKKYANAILYSNTLKSVSDEFRKEVVANIMNELLSYGITTLHAMEGGRMGGSVMYDPDSEFIYKYAKDYPIDMTLFYPTIDIEKIKKMGLKRIGGVIYIDGTLGERTAALTFDYGDSPGQRGIMCMAQEDINQFVLNCYKNRLQLSLFTLGDRAVEAALIAHEYAFKETGISGLRHRLEHIEIVNSDQIERASKLGLLFSMQPSYEAYWGAPGGMYEQRLGKYYGNSNKLREIEDKGVIICAGSDSDVTEPNPILGIHAAVNHPIKKHRLTVFEALKAYTYNGAYAIFEENKKGTLEIGKAADIVILNGDIMKINTEELKKLKVVTTIKSGEILYNAGMGEKC